MLQVAVRDLARLAGYANAITKAEINGTTVIIHAWKGWCPQFAPFLRYVFPGFSFPGGIGAEVGVYTYEGPQEGKPELAPPGTGPGWPKRLEDAIRAWRLRFVAHLQSPDACKVWWPASNAVVGSVAPVTFTLSSPHVADPIINGYTTNSYWTCKWMERSSFKRWIAARPTEAGLVARKLLSRNSEDFTLRFTVAGVEYVWAESTSEIVPVPA